MLKLGFHDLSLVDNVCETQGLKGPHEMSDEDEDEDGDKDGKQNENGEDATASAEVPSATSNLQRAEEAALLNNDEDEPKNVLDDTKAHQSTTGWTFS